MLYLKKAKQYFGHCLISFNVYLICFRVMFYLSDTMDKTENSTHFSGECWNQPKLDFVEGMRKQNKVI